MDCVGPPTTECSEQAAIVAPAEQAAVLLDELELSPRYIRSKFDMLVTQDRGCTDTQGT